MHDFRHVTCRQGDLSAEALQQRFALAFKGQAPELFVELAQLLPSQQQRSQLLGAAAAAGWLQSAAPGAAAEQASQPDEQGVPEPRSADGEGGAQQGLGPAWQPLDRSRIAAAASGLVAGSPADDMMLGGSRSAAADGAYSGAASTSGRGGGEADLPPGLDDGGPRPAKRTKR